MKINKCLISAFVASTLVTGCYDAEDAANDKAQIIKEIKESAAANKEAEAASKKQGEGLSAQIKSLLDEIVKQGGVSDGNHSAILKIVQAIKVVDYSEQLNEIERLADENSTTIDDIREFVRVIDAGRYLQSIGEQKVLLDFILKYGTLKEGHESIKAAIQTDLTQLGFGNKNFANKVEDLKTKHAKFDSDSKAALNTGEISKMSVEQVSAYMEDFQSFVTEVERVESEGELGGLLNLIVSDDSHEATKFLVWAPKAGIMESWEEFKLIHLSDDFDGADLPTLKALEFGFNAREDKGQGKVKDVITEITNLESVFVEVKALADANTKGGVETAQAAIKALYAVGAPLADMKAVIKAKAVEAIEEHASFDSTKNEGGSIEKALNDAKADIEAQ